MIELILGFIAFVVGGLAIAWVVGVIGRWLGDIS